ncbi:MFS transporter [Paraburkholderia sediminicola]|uniref:MFS transporter n=1 Tax=Paraburkholderia sediminicola TaxID=458836 RepID=UPI0038B6C8B2
MLTHQGDVATARESACKKAFWRVVPVLFLSYVFCSMDRYNIAFAQLQLREARHMSDSVYGLGASLFFVTYVLFAVPANLLLKRWGARRLFFLIVLGWGLCSTSMLFIRTPAEFYLGRLALGAFEAGFYPGVIYYLATWFPQDRRSKAFAVFTSGVTVAGVIVGPLSGWIMTKFDSAAGLAGWQWVFLLEGVPSCVMSLVCLVLLRRGPADASWLSEQERHALCDTLERERSEAHVTQGGRAIVSLLRDSRIYLFALVYFCAVSGIYALGFWVPAIIRSYGVVTPLAIGLYSVIPWGLAAIGTILISRHSDRVQERRWHFSVVIFAGAAALALSTIPHLNFPTAMLLLSIGAISVTSSSPLFWAMPTALLSPQSAAGGVALINCLAVTSGIVMPFAVGLLKEMTGSFSPGLWLLAGTLCSGALILLAIVPGPESKRTQDYLMQSVGHPPSVTQAAEEG